MRACKVFSCVAVLVLAGVVQAQPADSADARMLQDAESAAPPAPDASGAFALRASLVLRGGQASDAPFFGGAVGVQLDRFHGGLVYVSSSQAAPLGEVTLGYAVFDAGYDVLRFGQVVALAVRPRFELGVAFADGDPREANGGPASSRTPVIVARGAATLALQAAALGEIELSIELGSSLMLRATANAGFARGITATSGAGPIGVPVIVADTAGDTGLTRTASSGLRDETVGTTGGLIAGGALGLAWVL